MQNICPTHPFSDEDIPFSMRGMVAWIRLLYYCKERNFTNYCQSDSFHSSRNILITIMEPIGGRICFWHATKYSIVFFSDKYRNKFGTPSNNMSLD